MSKFKQEIKDRVNSRLDTLEHMLKQNIHLKDEHLFVVVLDMAVEYWDQLGEADREFYEAARWASDNKKAWTNK